MGTRSTVKSSIPDPRPQHVHHPLDRTWVPRSARHATRSSPPGGCCRRCMSSFRRATRRGRRCDAGVALTVAAADVLPPALTQAALVAALDLLAESFGRDMWWLWTHRHPTHGRAVVTAASGHGACEHVSPWCSRPRRSARVGRLLAPEPAEPAHGQRVLRIPVEGLVVIALALALPATARRLLAWVMGPILSLLVIVEILDIGFFATFDRPSTRRRLELRRIGSRRCAARSAGPPRTWPSSAPRCSAPPSSSSRPWQYFA